MKLKHLLIASLTLFSFFNKTQDLEENLKRKRKIEKLSSEGQPTKRQKQENKELDKQLYEAVRREDLSSVQYLISQGANVNSKHTMDQTPLHLAAEHNSVDIIKKLLKNGADPNALDMLNNTPLHFAVLHNKLENVKALINKGGDITQSNNLEQTPLSIAQYHQYNNLLELFDNMAKTNPRID